ncbi:MAG: SIMPL domain-containing protein, partial [Sporomusa sp.]
KAFIVTLLIMTAAVPIAAAAENNSNSTEVLVRGSYQQEITPDIAYINLGTLTEAETVAAAQSKNAEIMAKLYRQLKELAIKSDYIKTSYYEVTPVYKNDDNGRRLQTIRGYQATNNLMVTTSPEKVGQVIDTALKAGANQVNNIRFGKKEESDAKNAALAQAVRDAMSKAESIAATLNKRVVRIKSVNESNISMLSPETGSHFRLAITNDSMAGTTPISAGLLQLTANVQVVAELE